MTTLILTKEERTQAIINGFKGLPGEWSMLKGLLVVEHHIQRAAETKTKDFWIQRAEGSQFSEVLDMSMIAKRMDEINNEQLRDIRSLNKGEQHG